MARTAVYTLAPRGAFHFGERGIGVEETADLLHSDTLFSAFVSAWRALGEQPDPESGALPSLAPFVAGRPPFRISSAFPYAGDVLFFPRPAVRLGLEKALKRVVLLSEDALGLLSQGTLPSGEGDLIQGGQVWIAPDERRPIVERLLEGERDERERARLRQRYDADPRAIRLWSGSGAPPVPHVAVDRLSSASNLFFAGRLRFSPGCGLCFWAELADDAARASLETALAFLQDEGLGGRRSTGHGQFDFRRLDRDLPAEESPTGLVTLSLYRPSADEVARGVLQDAAYRRIHRQGWIYSPDGKNLRRRGLWMLREGAVLRPDVLAGAAAPGTIADVRPERGFAHPVYRYGYALTLPVRVPE